MQDSYKHNRILKAVCLRDVFSVHVITQSPLYVTLYCLFLSITDYRNELLCKDDRCRLGERKTNPGN